MQNSGGASTITATVPAQIIKESRIQPVWHVIVLNLLTLCFYAPIWFYKNSKDLSNRLKFSSDLGSAEGEPSDFNSQKKRKELSKKNKQKYTAQLVNLEASGTQKPDDNSAGGQVPVRVSIRDSSDENLAPLTAREKDVLDLVKRIPPLFLCLGMALPVINFILGTYFFKMLAELSSDASSAPRKHPWIAGLVLSVMLIGGLSLVKLPKIYFLLYCPGVCLPLSIAQHWLNDYWSKVETDKDLLVRHSFSTTELLLLIFGIMLLGLIIAGYFIVPFDVQH
jgi:hypothetical protein